MYRQFLPTGTSDQEQDEQQQQQAQPAHVTIVQDNAKCHPTSTSFKLRRQISQSQSNTTIEADAAEPINAAVGSSRWDATPQLDTTKKPNKDMGLKTPLRSRCDDSDSDGDIGIQGDEDPSESSSSSSSYEDLIACSDSILSIFPATRRAFSFTIPTTTTRTRRRPSPPIAAVQKTWSWPGCCYSNKPMLPDQKQQKHHHHRRRVQARDILLQQVPDQSVATLPTTGSADAPLLPSAATTTNSSPSSDSFSSPSSSSTVSPINIQEDPDRISNAKAHSKLGAAQTQQRSQQEPAQQKQHSTTKPRKQQLEGFISKSPPHTTYSDLASSSRRPRHPQGSDGNTDHHHVPFPTLKQQPKRHCSTSHLTTVVSSMTGAIQRGGRRDPNTSATATAATATSLDSLQQGHWFLQEPPASAAETAEAAIPDGANETIIQSAFENVLDQTDSND